VGLFLAEEKWRDFGDRDISWRLRCPRVFYVKIEWCACSRACLRHFNIINSACISLYQNAVAHGCATLCTTQVQYSNLTTSSNLIFIMFLPPSVSKSTSARASSKGSQRPRQGNAKQKCQAESSLGPGGARPRCVSRYQSCMTIDGAQTHHANEKRENVTMSQMHSA
jgi:hypothetical protein